jgi:hypothetical protein
LDEEVAQRGRVGALAGRGHDQRAGPLAPALVRDPSGAMWATSPVRSQPPSKRSPWIAAAYLDPERIRTEYAQRLARVAAHTAR